MNDEYLIPTTPEAAAAAIAARKGDGEFSKAILDPWNPRHARANEHWQALHQAAYPDGVTAPATRVEPAEQARERIEARKNDPDFVRRFSSGDVAAVREFEDLHRQAFPDDAPATEAAEPEAPVGAPLPLIFDKDTTPEQAAERHALADQVVKNLGMDRAEAHETVQALQSALTERNYTPMTSAELDNMEGILQAEWGANYGAKVTLAQAALRQAGPGADWLRESMLAAGPYAAVVALNVLADIGQRLRRK